MPEQTGDKWNWMRRSSSFWMESNSSDWASRRSPTVKWIRLTSKWISADFTTVGRSLIMSVSKQKTQVDGRLEDASVCQLEAGGLKVDSLSLGMKRGSTGVAEGAAVGGGWVIAIISSPFGSLFSCCFDCFFNVSSLCCLSTLLSSGLVRFLTTLAFAATSFGQSIMNQHC